MRAPRRFASSSSWRYWFSVSSRVLFSSSLRYLRVAAPAARAPPQYHGRRLRERWRFMAFSIAFWRLASWIGERALVARPERLLPSELSTLEIPPRAEPESFIKPAASRSGRTCTAAPTSSPNGVVAEVIRTILASLETPKSMLNIG